MDKELVQDTRVITDALLVRNSGSSQGTKKKTCHYCKKIRHLKADYWKLKKKDQCGESAEANLVNEFESNVLVATENLINFEQRWIFDSSCDYHIYLNRDQFTTYEPVNVVLC